MTMERPAYWLNTTYPGTEAAAEAAAALAATYLFLNDNWPNGYPELKGRCLASAKRLFDFADQNRRTVNDGPIPITEMAYK